MTHRPPYPATSVGQASVSSIPLHRNKTIDWRCLYCFREPYWTFYEHFVTLLWLFLPKIGVFGRLSQTVPWLRNFPATSFSWFFDIFFQFLLNFLLWLWNLDDLKSFQWRNLLKRAFQLKIIYIFVFFLDFLKTRFRGFANTLSEKSQDWIELSSWNFQGVFP